MAGSTHLLEVFDGGTPSDGLRDCRRSRFEFPGKVVGGESVEADVADHLASAEERWHLLQKRTARPECSDAGWAKHLVTGERDEVCVPCPNVHGEVRDRLACVHECEGPGAMSGVDEGWNVGDRPKHVRHRAECKEASPIKQFVEIVEVELIGLGEPDPSDLDGAFPRKHLPGDDVGVVLEVGEHDRVTRHQVGARPRVGNEVDGLGGVADKDDLGGIQCPDESRDGYSPRLERRGCLLSDGVHTSVDIRIAHAVVGVHGIEDP